MEGIIQLSEIGKIVDECWREIPKRFKNTRVDTYQVMPNHVHGIVEIRDWVKPAGRTRRGLINQTPTEHEWILMKRHEIPLGKVVRAFKAKCSRYIREVGNSSFRWQRNYHDHIVRDDRDQFFIEQYIQLNPLLWYLDSDNPDLKRMAPDDLRILLRDKFHIDSYSIERIIEYENDYRDWSAGRENASIM